jgi:hypothetical protein
LRASCTRGEGTALDFKSCQYLFSGEDDDTKSELLKDMLAFANSWRRSDAYILIGVKEVRGGRSIVKGLDFHLSDLDLQQFVCSKTNRPLEFAYQVHQMEGKEIGVIAIPLQERPFYLTRRFGKINARDVLVRRGSSADTAAPDEISRMGAVRIAVAGSPELSLCFVDLESGEPLGTSAEIEVVSLTLPTESDVPNYGMASHRLFGSLPIPNANRDFYRDVARYLDHRYGFCELPLLVENLARVSALDVTLQARIDDPGRQVRLLDGSDKQERPSISWYPNPVSLHLSQGQERYSVERGRDSWVLGRVVGKIQPKARQVVRGLLLGATEHASVTIAAQLFADNLPDPASQDLHVEVRAKHEVLAVDDLLRFQEARD